MSKLASKDPDSGSLILDSITLSMQRVNTTGAYKPNSLILLRFMLIARKIGVKVANKRKPKYRTIIHTPSDLARNNRDKEAAYKKPESSK
ncbi:hypothetical protein [Streptococcus xiaochunlingii]|uniref:hypothetical protein n=1 Tax=Streptococcus xiaochunlingii TaxID=2589788 RepID=UPI0012B97F4A|nr:hypothetical protein [Streptococcus xiaochunlingii]